MQNISLFDIHLDSAFSFSALIATTHRHMNIYLLSRLIHEIRNQSSSQNMSNPLSNCCQTLLIIEFCLGILRN